MGLELPILKHGDGGQGADEFHIFPVNVPVIFFIQKYGNV